LGVADGVGQYMDAGVGAGAFSRGLMESASAEVAGLEPGTPICPRALLERAYEKTAASGAPGASTTVILSLAAGNALAWAYIGDSAFAVLRGSKIVFLSTPQRHLSRTSRSKHHFASTPARRKEHLFSFNDPPFQLSVVAARSDSVADAVVGQVAVRTGDVVVAGTDGLFDNVLDDQLERVVQMGTKLGFSPKNMADIIAAVAYERSNESSSRKLRKGKPGDITVLVAFIVPLGS
jgi:protein phosphatase PTC7